MRVQIDIIAIVSLLLLCNSLSTTRPISRMLAALWDLDGTLLDTETLSTEAIDRILEPTQQKITWNFKKTLLGLPGPTWSQMLVTEYSLTLTPVEVVQRWESNLCEMSHRIEKMVGALETVEFVHKEMKVPQAIATSSTAVGVEQKRAKHGDLFSYMATVVTGDDPELQRGKPSPDIFLLAAQRLGVEPDTHALKRVVVFEDSLSGVEAALSAGMFCIAVPDPRLDSGPFQALIDRYEGRGLICGSLSQIDWTKVHDAM